MTSLGLGLSKDTAVWIFIVTFDYDDVNSFLTL